MAALSPAPLLVALGSLALAGCHAGAARAGAQDSGPGPGAGAALAPPDGWRDASPHAFEALALAWPPGDAPRSLDDAGLGELRAALASADETSVRAAVLLARSGDPRAGEALLQRLEARVEHAERHADAGDVVAAAALWEWDFAPDVAARLAALAVGPRVHPDLEVRVECAASALGAGRDEVIPFLLRVLRAGTPAERDHPPDWRPTTTLAWSKSRAAEALARRAGSAPAFRPDGSYAHQVAEAERLERALAR